MFNAKCPKHTVPWFTKPRLGRCNHAVNPRGCLLFLAVVVISAGCEPGEPAGTITAERPADVRARINYRNPRDRANWLTPAQAAQMIRDKPDLQVLCVANIEDYRAAHLPESMLIPVMGLRLAIDDNTLYEAINHGRTPGKDRPLLVYCWWNACKCPSVPAYSELARQILREKGFTDVYSIEGGMRAWIVAHLPYEKDEPAPSATPPARALARQVRGMYDGL